jgi:hypothetical protein
LDKEGDRKVTMDEGVNFAKRWGMDFFEVSSTQRINVDDVFVKLCPRILQLHGAPRVTNNKSVCKTQ